MNKGKAKDGLAFVISSLPILSGRDTTMRKPSFRITRTISHPETTDCDKISLTCKTAAPILN